MSTNKRRSFLKHTAAGLLGLMSYPSLASVQELAHAKPSFSGKSRDDLYALVRQELLLDKDLVYLNTGSLGPSPKLVVDKVHEVVHQLERNPVINNWGTLGKEMEAVREKAANFLNAERDEIILTRNTTEGLNLVGSSLNLNKGDEILTTNHEHGGGEVGIEFMAAKSGASLRKITMPLPAESKEQIIQLIKSSIKPNTRVLLLSHVVTITGVRLPIEDISGITRENGIFLIVDGAQAAGMLNIDVKKLGVDIYATSGHKWLMGPKETGILYIRKGVQNKINPVFLASGYNSYSASSGTRNVANFIGLGEALWWQETIGRQNIESGILELSAYCRKKLADVPGVDLLTPADSRLASAMVSIGLQEADNRKIFTAMKEKGIIIKLLPRYNALRFSTHMFNNQDDIEQMVEQLKLLLTR
jgi:selenocysteine lyase/cysteine desulfurase